jgi:translation initiation factor 3 subunit B
VLKWSHDDKYFAKLKDKKEGEEHHQAISVYSTPDFDMLDKKSIKIDNIQGFQWSPTDNIISYWAPEQEQGNMPAKIMLMAIPSREEISTNMMVLLKDCRMVWQKSGDYMCVSAERWVNKNKKNTSVPPQLFFPDALYSPEWRSCHTCVALHCLIGVFFLLLLVC